MKTWIQGKAHTGWLTMLAVSLALMGGCAGTSQPSSFYLLRSLPETGGESAASSEREGLSVLVGPVTLPAYLDRTQVLTLTGKNEVSLDEFNRWAEPLQDNFYRVLVENLSLLLQTPAVYSYDRRGSERVDFQVIVQVTRFDSDARGDACLVAFWSVTGLEGRKGPLTRKSVIRKAAESSGVLGAVDAQNHALAEFSREIASAVQSLRR